MAGRYELSDTQFDQIRDVLPGKPGDRGRTAQDNHRFINGVLWVLRSGAHWHDMPSATATGKAPTNASAAGPGQASGRQSSSDC